MLQTKETLTLRASSFGSKCEVSDKLMKKLGNDCGIIELVASFASFKNNKELKKGDGAKRSRIPGVSLKAHQVGSYVMCKRKLEYCIDRLPFRLCRLFRRSVYQLKLLVVLILYTESQLTNMKLLTRIIRSLHVARSWKQCFSFVWCCWWLNTCIQHTVLCFTSSGMPVLCYHKLQSAWSF